MTIDHFHGNDDETDARKGGNVEERSVDDIPEA
jgi:hypothetical protein